MPVQKKSGDKSPPEIQDLISLKKASEISGLSHDHLRRLAGNNSIWAIKIGRNWVTTQKAVQDYLALNKHPGRPFKTT